MKTVRISIFSQARDAIFEADIVKSVAWGKLTERYGKLYAVYEETAETGFSGTTTVLKWNDEKVSLIRYGRLEHRQEFAVGLVDTAFYKTPYLDIPIVVKTNALRVHREGQKWLLEIDYTTEIGNNPPSEICLRIEIEEETAGEC